MEAVPSYLLLGAHVVLYVSLSSLESLAREFLDCWQSVFLWNQAGTIRRDASERDWDEIWARHSREPTPFRPYCPFAPAFCVRVHK